MVEPLFHRVLVCETGDVHKLTYSMAGNLAGIKFGRLPRTAVYKKLPDFNLVAREMA